MQELIDTCAAAGFRQMIGYIDADNTASLAIHEKFGFRQGWVASGHRLSIRPLDRHRHGATLARVRQHHGALMEKISATRTARFSPRPSSRRPHQHGRL